MLIAIIIIVSCIVVAIGFGAFFLVKVLTHFKETETRNKYMIRLAIVVVLTVILGVVNSFLILTYSLDKASGDNNNSSIIQD